MAKYSKKVMGKEVGEAKTYAEPHTMSGKSVQAKVPEKTGTAYMNEMNISIGNTNKVAPGTKTSGIKMRGAGAATKGTMCRGPMA